MENTILFALEKAAEIGFEHAAPMPRSFPWEQEAANSVGAAPIRMRRADSLTVQCHPWRQQDCLFPMSARSAAFPITAEKTRRPLLAVFCSDDVKTAL